MTNADFFTVELDRVVESAFVHKNIYLFGIIRVHIKHELRLSHMKMAYIYMIRDVLCALRIHDVKNVNNKLYCMSEASELDRANIWKAIQAHCRSHYTSNTRKIANEPVE